MRRAAWWAGVLCALGAAHAAGRGPLWVGAPLRWASWVAVERSWGPVVAAVSVVRIGVVAVGLYLVAVLALAEVARLPRGGRRAAALLARVPFGRLVAAQVVAATVVVGAAGPVFADPAPVMHVVARPSTTTTAPPTTAAGSTTTAPPPAPLPPAPAAPPTPAPAPVQPQAAPGPATVVLARGDSLWSAAESHLTAALGRPPDPREVGAYWWQVVEANRHRLADPDDPSFVLPGFVVTLPPVG